MQPVIFIKYRLSKSMIAFITSLALYIPFSYSAESSASVVADKIQKVYDSTSDLQAAFQQEYFSKALDRRSTSSGYVYIKKPGMMRWDYKEPRPKHFVADGKSLYVYDPELQQVMIYHSFSDLDLSTAVTFLWGKGRLGDEFDISFSNRLDLGGDKFYVLDLLPKKKARFSRIIFVVERETFRVFETIMMDPGGNVNHIFFADISTNVGLKDESFKLDIPKDIEVIEAPNESP